MPEQRRQKAGRMSAQQKASTVSNPASAAPQHVSLSTSVCYGVIIVGLLAIVLGMWWSNPRQPPRQPPSAAVEVHTNPVRSAVNQVLPSSEPQESPVATNTKPAKDTQESPTSWRRGMNLLRDGEVASALHYLQVAVQEEPDNDHRLKTLGVVAVRTGDASLAVESLSRCLEILLSLEQGSWRDVMIASSASFDAPEEADWVRSEGQKVLDTLTWLLKAYELGHMHLESFALSSLLAAAQYDNLARLDDVVTSATRLGLLRDALHAELLSLQRRFEAEHPQHDSYEPVMAAAAEVLLAGLEAKAVAVARLFLLADAPMDVKDIATNCDVDVADAVEQKTVSAAFARSVVAKCIMSQRILESLVEKGALLNEEAGRNGFLFAPLHQAAMTDNADITRELIRLGAQVSVKNTLNQTPLHVAAARNSNEVASLLLEVDPQIADAKDAFGRTAADVACLHSWNTSAFTSDKASFECQGRPTAEAWQQHMSTNAAGGWRAAAVSSITFSGKQVDAHVSLSTEAFLRDYLSVQRPVVVRSAAQSAVQAWENLQWRLSRSSLQQEFGTMACQVSTIPYGAAFGMKHQTMQLSDYLQILDDPPPDSEAPLYMFQSIPPAHPLSKAMYFPAFVDSEALDMEFRPFQLFLGPMDSGAPLHFHRGAVNVLVYGARRWLLLPPHAAEYSIVPSKSLFSSRQLAEYRAKGVAYELLQLPGDVVFIPEGWAHATLNLADSVGYAAEFVWGASEFSLADPFDESQDDSGDEI